MNISHRKCSRNASCNNDLTLLQATLSFHHIFLGKNALTRMAMFNTGLICLINVQRACRLELKDLKVKGKQQTEYG